jgi:protein TonB
MKKFVAVVIASSFVLVATAAHAAERVGAVSVLALGAAAPGATALARPLPAYPRSALREGNDYGRVVLGYDVGADGRVADVRVLAAQPVQVFTRSAVNAVRGWQYLPGAPDRRVVEFTFLRD